MSLEQHLEIDPKLDKLLPISKRLQSIDDELIKYFNNSYIKKGHDKNYPDTHHQKILQTAKTHSNKHSKPITKNNLLVLVHPFYMQTMDNELLQSFQNKNLIPDSNQYLETLIKLLNNQQFQANYDTILLETGPIYATTSNQLTNQGLINQTIYTTLGTGNPRPQELETFQNLTNKKNIFICGQYNHACVSNTINNLQNPTEIYGVPELTLNTTNSSCETLFPEQIAINIKDSIPKEKNVKIIDLIK